MKLKVAVVGAGVIGLSTALHLTERFPDALQVTIIADRFTPDTVSDKSAAVIKPLDFYRAKGSDQFSSAKDVSAYQDRVARWYQDTMKRFHKIHVSEDNSEVKLTLLAQYHLQQHEDTPDPSWKDVVFGFRHVYPDSDETSLFNFPPECKTIWSYSTYTVNPTLYLQWMQKQILSKGATIKKVKIDSLQEIYDGFDVVVNCTGVWASHLLEKESMQPARGQHILVKAPWINHCIHYDPGPKRTYIIARSDSVALGGTLEPGNWSEKIEEETTKEILKRCTEIEPSLAKAEVIGVSVGLRPLRSRIRLEKSLESESPLVIHCYGHGGQGITLSWGCAKEIGDIVQDSVIKNKHRLVPRSCL